MVNVGTDTAAATSIKLLALLKSIGISESWLTLTLKDVDKAMVEALEEWGRPTSDPQRGIAHCAEELGEAAKEATNAMRAASRVPGTAPNVVALRKMYGELCQLSAYSALLATSMVLLAREVEDNGKR